MKRKGKLLSGVLATSMIISSLVIPGSYVLASESGLADIFTDPNFLEYVEQFDLDDSGTLSSDEIEKVTRIDCENLGIKSLDGIEIFTNLEELKCGYNELSFLSFPNLPIKVLNVRHNDLYTLDISALTNLQELYCENTALTSLNITSKELKVLVCNDNNIDRIDLSSTKIANVELAIKRFETYVIELKEDVNEYDNSYNFAPDGFIYYKDYLVITDGFTFINGTNVDFSVFDYTPVAFDSENFHDENFLALLLNQIDYNKNGYLDAFERRNKTSFEIGRVTCDSFDGIQYFPFIKYLGMDDMRIGKMDLSQNSDISSIYIGGSVIGTIDLGDNTALNEFICVDTNISEIDFTGTNYTNLDLEVIHKDGLTIIYDAVTDTDKINHNSRYSFDYKSSFIVVDDSIAIKGLDVEMPELNDIDSVLINQAYFPDEGFRTYLKSEFDKNKDSKLDKDELAKIDALRLRGLGIESLEGIKFFDNLKVIFAADNKLTSLDISNNTKLDSIDVSNNNLTSIDVSNNSSLRKIIAYGNSIKSINLSGTNIDKSDMICEYYGPFLVVRDLPGEYVTLYEYCDECIEIEFGNSIGIFDSVEITGVASISSMPTPPVNAVRPFKINDTIKDSNLQSIIKSFDKNNDGYIEDSENKNINILNCPNRNIASLEGIEKLANLQVLVCNGNPLTEIDVSNNKMLQQINCFSCNLESLTLGDNPELLSIIAYSNKIKSLDISGASKLANLICFSNELDELTISNNTELMTLMVYDNNLKSLDVSGCNKLVQISAYNNELTSLTLGSLSKLSQLLIYGNNLSVIDVSETNLATMALEKTASDYVTTYSDNAEGEKNYSGFVETLEGKADFSAKYSSLIFICDSSATVSDMKEEELGYPEFVDYLYKNVLEREPDENKATYVQQLEDGATGLKLINEFFNSDEFIAACHTNEEYIQILYKSFFNQDNNEDGINYWMSRFDEGITREEIFMVFADTIEWKSICESFGVNPGSTDDLLPTTTPEPTATATPVPTATPTPEPTATPVPTATATPVPTATATPVPTATATPVPTATATPAPTATATPVSTATATPAPTATAIPVPTATATPVPTATATPVPTATATPVPTATATPVPTEVPTVAPTTIPTSEPTAVPTEKPTVAPTTVPTTEPTPEVELTDTPTPTPEKADVSSFAERLYTTCLGRESEEDGKDYWASELKSGKTGAEVAEGFFFSPEFKEKNLSDEEYIGSLYETFMGRTPADEEVAYWASEMKNGLDRKSVFDGFINSPEWADICLDYGIRSGGLAQPTHEKEASEEVKAFAERLYTTCLGRDSEDEGLKYWSQELANLRNSGTEAARGFFFSPEFIDLNLSNEEYVTRLYKTFMGREPEKEGFDYWVGQLNNGASREDVFNGFSAAPEFGDICAEAGIFR